MKSVVITGVSTGIGHAAAETLIRNGVHVFGSVRKKADADRVKNELGPFFTPLIFDVTDEAAIRRAADEVRKELNGQKLAGLVNNAGIAVAGPLLHMPPDELRHLATGRARIEVARRPHLRDLAAEHHHHPIGHHHRFRQRPLWTNWSKGREF